MTRKNHKSRSAQVRARLTSIIPSPLRRATFRRLWLGMNCSNAGTRLQQLAQAWFVATLTGSAMAVGWITILSSIPLLLLPLGGVIADQVDRRRLLITWQMIGALSTAVVAFLVIIDHIAIWHIYFWALINGLIALFSRPAYKVVLTGSVPHNEVRSAVAINSMTETMVLVIVNGAGSVILGILGLAVAFILNTATYLIAALNIWNLRSLGQQTTKRTSSLDLKRIFSDLVAGVNYLVRQPRILHPLLVTFSTIIIVGPVFGLLASIVQVANGSIIDLGILAAAFSFGAVVGAGFAGARSAGENPTKSYALLGLVNAAALAIFALLPIGYFSIVPLMILGTATFTQAVWNTSRIQELAQPSFQARLQAITSMAFTLGFSLGMLWAGIAIDVFGLVALAYGALVLGFLSLVVLAKLP